MKKYKNKLRYRSWHRGTKEADLLLGKFFDYHADKMTYEVLLDYEDFLNKLNDNDVLYILKRQKTWSSKLPVNIVKLLEEFINSENFK